MKCIIYEFKTKFLFRIILLHEIFIYGYFFHYRVTRVTGKTLAVAGEWLKLVVTVAASSIWGSWLARAATSVVLGGLRRGERPRCLREWRVASAAQSWTLWRDDLVCHRCWGNMAFGCFKRRHGERGQPQHCQRR
jgi:hypothetical protein